MLAPKNNKIIYWLMHCYVKFLVDAKFQQMLFNDVEIDKNKSVFVLKSLQFLKWVDNALRKRIKRSMPATYYAAKKLQTEIDL